MFVVCMGGGPVEVKKVEMPADTEPSVSRPAKPLSVEGLEFG